MPSYLVETYAPGSSDLADLAEKARNAADGQVRYVRSVFVPEDETCFHVFEGPSARAIEVLAKAAPFAGARIVEAIEGTDGRGRERR